MKVRLHIGVATLFTFLTLVVTATLVAILYFGNRELAIRTAKERMAEARSQSVDEMLTVILGAGGVVSSASVFLSNFSEDAGSSAGLDVLYDEPDTLSYQIDLNCPIGADVRHMRPYAFDGTIHQVTARYIEQ
ncbi:hypothetical protein [Ruegeria sp. HKCCA4008]|uniref:hypothetical protein n=1 Tax=Ruegeria sp. HKCCA4008 TaxID=2682999 RepID=UPI001488B4DD|nr:hypothetical protein [Ruegeria sp. HKCCA4008]